MPQVSVSSKTLLTRAQRRTILRHHLRDTNSTVFTDTVLNVCLNEALAIVQQRYPWITSTILSTVSALGYRVYDLPADYVRMHSVLRLHDGDATGLGVDPAPGGQVITGYSVSVGSTRDIAVTASTSTHVLILEEDITRPDRLLIYYEAARQPWGDVTVVSGGVDATADQDLRPGELTDGEADLLFYAAARVAAYRYALGYIKADSGDDWAVQYEFAVKERDRLLGESAPGRVLRFSNGLF